MIRPLTLLTAALAIGSGFYLYQAKHRTKLLDQRITLVEQEISTAHNRIAVLRAEWALENAPSRLADLAARYLVLEPMKPSQAVSMANLAARLPPPGSPPPGLTVPELPRLANFPALALFASLDLFAPTSAPAPPSAPVPPTPATVAAASPVQAASTPSLPAPPPAPLPTTPRSTAPSALAALSLPAAPPTAPVPPGAHLPTPAPFRIPIAKRLSPAAAGLAAPAHQPPAALPAAPRSTPPPATRPLPVLTSALGGSYPDLPPPAPLSGSH